MLRRVYSDAISSVKLLSHCGDFCSYVYMYVCVYLFLALSLSHAHTHARACSLSFSLSCLLARERACARVSCPLFVYSFLKRSLSGSLSLSLVCRIYPQDLTALKGVPLLFADPLYGFICVYMCVQCSMYVFYLLRYTVYVCVYMCLYICPL